MSRLDRFIILHERTLRSFFVDRIPDVNSILPLKEMTFIILWSCEIRSRDTESIRDTTRRNPAEPRRVNPSSYDLPDWIVISDSGNHYSRVGRQSLVWRVGLGGAEVFSPNGKLLSRMWKSFSGLGNRFRRWVNHFRAGRVVLADKEMFFRLGESFLNVRKCVSGLGNRFWGCGNCFPAVLA